MRTEVARIQRRLGTTMVYVTHDQTEAMTLGDRVAVMRAGIIQQVDSPATLYDEMTYTATVVPSLDATPCRMTVASTIEGDNVQLLYNGGEFLSVQDYKNVQRWTAAIAARPAVKRGRIVNRVSGDPANQLRERHDAADFDTKTQDKIGEEAKV